MYMQPNINVLFLRLNKNTVEIKIVKQRIKRIN
jgi:hypothetical protein